MNVSVATRYAVRSLGRNLRRTLLSAVGVGIGCAIGLVTIGWVRGERSLFVRAAAESGAGHLRIAPAGWARRHDDALRLRDPEHELAAARALDGVAIATPRVRTQALLALGTRTSSVEIVGVDPRTEARALRFVRHVSRGRYLRPGDDNAVVVGRALARRLDADLDDDLVATAIGAGGSMQSTMLHIVGIVDTGSREIDLALCQVMLSDAERLTGRPGLGEVTLLLRDAETLEAARQALASAVAPGDTVLAWYDVSPELRAGVDIDAAWANVTIIIVLFVVFLGVASAQLTAVLERRRELAVLAAIGMRTRVMVRLVLAEGLALGLAGALFALGIGVPALWYLSSHGVDIRALVQGDLTLSGVLVDPVFHADLGLWVVPYALVLAVAATVLASIYPAWFAARTDPAVSLRAAP